MDSNLVKRILFAAVAIPLALGVVWMGGWPLAALVALVAWLGCNELFGLAVANGIRPLRRTGCILAGAIPLVMQLYLSVPVDGLESLGIFSLGFFPLLVIVVLAIMLFRRGTTEKPLEAVSITILGIIYTGLLPSSLLLIRGNYPFRNWDGVTLVFFPLVVTWVCDTAAMFGGRAFGRVKLAPEISPGKTREGAVVGVIGGLMVAAIFGLFLFPGLLDNGRGGNPSLTATLIVGLILSIVGQIGDLVESLFKREAGVKDSSHLIPGHGGILDRFDSLYFVLPVAACWYLIMGFHP